MFNEQRQKLMLNIIRKTVRDLANILTILDKKSSKTNIKNVNRH